MMTADDTGPMDINAIMQTLPHRYPMLLVDRVLSCVPGERLRAVKNVTMNDPFFSGHFPGFPVMPGVMVIEALAQASAILAYRTAGTRSEGDSLFFFTGIDNARFRRQVVPGDQLILEVEVLRIARGVGKFATQAKVGDEIAAEAELMALLRPANTNG
jgi:3-hydroxyacyl-[acyl-carrier-protein] dehydratase